MSPQNEPTTHVDPRYGHKNNGPTSWEDTRQVIEEAQLFWITTVRADGRPHCVPLVAVWWDGALYFTTGGEEQKYLNLAANPHVLLTTGCNTWESGLDVVVEGIAAPVTDDTILAQLVDVWAKKWDGNWQYSAHDGKMWHDDTEFAYAFCVTPTRVLAFSKGKFSQTTHRFA